MKFKLNNAYFDFGGFYSALEKRVNIPIFVCNLSKIVDPITSGLFKPYLQDSVGDTWVLDQNNNFFVKFDEDCPHTFEVLYRYQTMLSVMDYLGEWICYLLDVSIVE